MALMENSLSDLWIWLSSDMFEALSNSVIVIGAVAGGVVFWRRANAKANDRFLQHIDDRLSSEISANRQAVAQLNDEIAREAEGLRNSVERRMDENRAEIRTATEEIAKTVKEALARMEDRAARDSADAILFGEPVDVVFEQNAGSADEAIETLTEAPFELAGEPAVRESAIEGLEFDFEESYAFVTPNSLPADAAIVVSGDNDAWEPDLAGIEPVETRHGEVVVDVHFATNRNATGSTAPNKFFGPERAEQSYGVVQVTLPRDHEIGVIERPAFWRLQFSENPAKHIVLRSIVQEDKDAFFKRMSADVENSEDRAVFVFVHGFNVTFAEAARRTAQLASDLFKVGVEGNEATLAAVPVMFSWPSEGKTLLYLHDSANAEASVPYFKQFVSDIAARSGATSLTIVAHSMGTRVLTAALRDLSSELDETQKPIVTEIVLAAPDIDKDVFSHIADAVKRTGERMTIYTSDCDKALHVSKALNGFPRLGDSSEEVAVFDGIDTIDSSEVGDDILAHSYYGETSVIKDLHSIIVEKTPARRRFGLDTRGAPPRQYWWMRPRAG